MQEDMDLTVFFTFCLLQVQGFAPIPDDVYVFLVLCVLIQTELYQIHVCANVEQIYVQLPVDIFVMLHKIVALLVQYVQILMDYMQITMNVCVAQVFATAELALSVNHPQIPVLFQIAQLKTGHQQIQYHVRVELLYASHLLVAFCVMHLKANVVVNVKLVALLIFLFLTTTHEVPLLPN